jgi:hypothetical protein
MKLLAAPLLDLDENSALLRKWRSNLYRTLEATDYRGREPVYSPIRNSRNASASRVYCRGAL